MPEVLVATPLKYYAANKPYQFADGICIRELSPILWDISVPRGYISEHDRDDFAKTRYWLCAIEERGRFNDDTDELSQKALHAAWALQIICPTGAKHTFLTLNNTDRGYDNIGLYQRKELCSTVFGRIAHLENRGLEQQFDAVYKGVRHAFTEHVVRLQNPIQLLEHGMQIGNPNLGILMFVMGLDVLFMAGEIDKFMKRVGGFFGLRTLLFPPDSLMNRQPNTMLIDVLNDVYVFRNIIAHGQEIPKHPYREQAFLTSTDGYAMTYNDCTYVALLLESSLFMLTTALRRIFTEGLFDDVKDPARWRCKMTLYEHRYKDAAGPPPAKPRGR